MRMLSFLFFLNFSNIIFAQNSNYLVTSNGDTAYGNVSLNQKQFSLTTLDKKVQTFSADDVQFVYSSNFKGHAVVHCLLNTYTDNLYEMDLGYLPIRSVDTVLILSEIYSTPKMNLYYCIDKKLTPYYFYKTPADSVPVQLVVRFWLDGGLTTYSRNVAGYRGERSRVHIEEQKGYVNQLKFLMKNCTAISEEDWELLDYRRYSLKKIIRKYNSCD